MGIVSGKVNGREHKRMPISKLLRSLPEFCGALDGIFLLERVFEEAMAVVAMLALGFALAG